jgi:hypothetical protein
MFFRMFSPRREGRGKKLKSLMIFINVAPLINTHLNDYKLLYNCVEKRLNIVSESSGVAREFCPIKINEFQKAIKQNPKNDEE